MSEKYTHFDPSEEYELVDGVRLEGVMSRILYEGENTDQGHPFIVLHC